MPRNLSPSVPSWPFSPPLLCVSFGAKGAGGADKVGVWQEVRARAGWQWYAVHFPLRPMRSFN